MRIYLMIILLIFATCLTSGCTGNPAEMPVRPDVQYIARHSGSHYCWGEWRFIADPARGMLDIEPLRAGDMHLNALVFLEPPALVNLTLEYLKFNGNHITADIGLRHPFSGLTEFTGFDVCGVFISNGSLTGFSDPELRMTQQGDTRLVNPDGYTRWWNPSEFPHDGTMLGYNDGLLGTPDSSAHYNCKLNAYKYYTDELNPQDDYLGVDPARRGMFSAGKKNVRRYEIELGGDGLTFNYAVDAAWKYPSGSSPWVAPDDFPPEANRPEAWGISVHEVENTLWYEDASGEGGGEYIVQIHVYDHFDANLNTVRIEAPGIFPAQSIGAPTGGTAEYSTYEFDVTGIEPTSNADTLMLITVECEKTGYQDILPGKPISAYAVRFITLANEPPATEWSEPVTIDTDAEMPRACRNHNGDIVLAYHKSGSIHYAVYTGGWSTPAQAYNTNPTFMHIIIGESGATTYISYKGWGSGGNDRHALRYQGNPGAWDYMWLYGFTDQPSILLPDDDGSFAHIYTFITGFQIIGFDSWGSGWSGMTWADGYGVEMASTNFAERDGTNHFVAYYKDDYARLCRIAKSTINTHPVYTIYQCASGEDVDSTALARENDPSGTLHAVYRVTDASGYRIEYKSSVDKGQTWSSPASIIYDETYPPLMNYVSIAVDKNGVLHVTYADSKWIYWTYSDDGITWAKPDNLFFINPAPISVHVTQPYLLSTGDCLHLFFIDKMTMAQYGALKWVFKPIN